MELPVLRLGMVGFTPDQERAIREIASTRPALHWIFGSLGGADAWLLNGARTQAHSGGAIRIASGVPGGRSVQLQVEGARRPVAFALPLPPTIEASCLFDLYNAASLHRTLDQFEGWLGATLAHFRLASSIVDHEKTLGNGVFELRAGDQLVGVLDMRGDVAMRPGLLPHQLDAAVWKQVARDAKKVPPEFLRMRLEHLMWQYCLRSRRDLLPPRYRAGPIYFRRPPRVEPNWVRDEHLVVLRDLTVQPATFEDLAQRTGLREEQLGRVLGALYYVGSITANPTRAEANASSLDTSSSGGLLSMQADPTAEQAPAYHTVPNYHELTAPVPLRE